MAAFGASLMAAFGVSLMSFAERSRPLAARLTATRFGAALLTATPLTGTRLAAVLLAAALLAGCGDGEAPDSGGDVYFPADYAATYTEVRNCRPSGDHDLNTVRILADSAALEAYNSRNEPFPEGAVVLKEEYEFGDDTCSGELVQWTVMKRLAEGSSPETLDWDWQSVDRDRNVSSQNAGRCIGCHQGCGVAPDGYQGTCAVP